MFKKVLFSLSIVTFLTACGSSSNTQVSVAISGAVIDHAIKVCTKNEGLYQIHAKQKGAVIKHYQTYAECKNGASFKLQYQTR